MKIGERMSFIRFLGCNLSCNYCDTPETQKKDGVFVHLGKIHKNPISLATVLQLIDSKTVSLTGGEPLLQIGFLTELCATLRDKQRRIYLETNGTMPSALLKVIDYIDIISLDFKIPTATGRPQHWKEHAESLVIAATKEVFVKMVINENVLPHELEKACEIISAVDSNIPLIIQPVFGASIPNILDIQQHLMGALAEVRVIPQVHKYLTIR